EYDQSAAGKAITAFTDFIALFPDDERVPEARQHIIDLYRVQAEGSYRIARFYEKKNSLDGAVIYYATVVDLYTRLIKEPESPRVREARQRIAEIGARRSARREETPSTL